MKRFLLVLLSLSFCLYYPACAQFKNQFPTAINLDAKITALMQEADIPGLSIALIKNGKLSYAKGYGLSNTATKNPIINNTVFEAASLGKPLFGYLILKLVDKGILELDTRLSHYAS